MNLANKTNHENCNKKKNIQEKKKKSICSRMVYNSAKIQKKKRDIVMKVRQKTKRKKR